MIQDDIREISCMLVSEGYDFADAEGLGYTEEPVAHIEVRGAFRVTVEITERHDTDGDELESLIGLDGGDDLGFIHSTLNQIRAGELRVASLRAKLEQLDDDGDVLEEIDYLYLGGVTYNPKIRCFGGAEKEIAADLFSQNEKLIFSFANEMSTVSTRQEVAA